MRRKNFPEQALPVMIKNNQINLRSGPTFSLKIQTFKDPDPKFT